MLINAAAKLFAVPADTWQIQRRQLSDNGRSGALVLENGIHECHDEGVGHSRSNEIGDEEDHVLGEGEQQGVEQHQGDAHQGILDGNGKYSAFLRKSLTFEGIEKRKIGMGAV